ncbi:MAG: glycosyltransferase [Lachnospiraceae bacterium]|nr:glycosyltransferase [Lachnospiraceae bacterium]
MGKLTIANLKKTIYYLKRNGLRNTWNAARERLSAAESYEPKLLTEEERKAMRQEVDAWMAEAAKTGESLPYFSILVPAYRTRPEFLKELVESVGAQVYPNWELLILDASEEESVKDALKDICGAAELRLQIVQEAQTAGESRIVRYTRLAENAGISENTNAGLPYVTGDYVGLLDHDDVLTPDALYEMAALILSEEKAPVMLYSDEDKWDGDARYYEPNFKEDFNLDLLLSNNYICHFLVMDTMLFKELKLRKAFDGAQDYDLVLRASARIMAQAGADNGEAGALTMLTGQIRHIPKVLYHWRCHEGSTAENPQSKLYAYDTGRRALQDFADRQGWNAKAQDLKHVGFYRLCFPDWEKLLEERKDIGAIGGKILSKGAIAGGRMTEETSVYYEGLKEGFSGYLHRGVLTQDAEAVDLRCICVAKEFWPLLEEVVGVPYRTRKLEIKGADGKEIKGTIDIFDAGALPESADVKALSIRFCSALQERGKRILWDPEVLLRL